MFFDDLDVATLRGLEHCGSKPLQPPRIVAWSSCYRAAGILAAPPFLSVQPALDRFSHGTRRASNLFIGFIDGSSPEVEREAKSRYCLQGQVRTLKVRPRMHPALFHVFEACDSPNRGTW